jgi:hypothetical protein
VLPQLDWVTLRRFNVIPSLTASPAFSGQRQPERSSRSSDGFRRRGHHSGSQDLGLIC